MQNAMNRIAIAVAAAALLAFASATPKAPPAGEGAQLNNVVAAEEPPRRNAALPGLETHEHLVDPTAPWYARAKAGAARARASSVIIQNTQHPDWPPLSGFLISPRYVVTAHLRELGPGEEAPTFTVRHPNGRTTVATQVQGWRRWDMGILELQEPSDAPPITFGDEKTLKEGDILINIGNPSAAGRTGLLLATIGTFARTQDGYIIGDISTLAGGSGSPVTDIDGNLVGMSSMGIGFDIIDVERMTVSELRIRNVLPVARGPGAAGASATTIAELTKNHR